MPVLMLPYLIFKVQITKCCDIKREVGLPGSCMTETMFCVSLWQVFTLIIISAQVSPQSHLHTADSSEAGVAAAPFSDVDLPAADCKNCIWNRFFLPIQKKRSGLRLSHTNPWLRVSKRSQTKNSGRLDRNHLCLFPTFCTF